MNTFGINDNKQIWSLFADVYNNINDRLTWEI